MSEIEIETQAYDNSERRHLYARYNRIVAWHFMIENATNQNQHTKLVIAFSFHIV